MVGAQYMFIKLNRRKNQFYNDGGNSLLKGKIVDFKILQCYCPCFFSFPYFSFDYPSFKTVVRFDLAGNFVTQSL